MPFHLPPPVPVLDVTLATHGMAKGISYSDGSQAVVRIGAKSGGFQVFGQWKNIPAAQGTGEGQLIVGWSGKAAGLDVGGTVARKFVTSPTNHQADNAAWELTTTAGRKFGRVIGLKATAYYSPDELGATTSSLYVEAGPSLTLPDGFVASAAIGHRRRGNSPDYTAYNVGMSKTIAKRMTLDLRYYDNDHNELGYVYKRRLIGSLRLVF